MDAQFNSNEKDIEIEKLYSRINELESTVEDLKAVISATNEKSGNVIERLGKVLGEEMSFVKELMTEDINQAKVYADVLKTNFIDLTQRVGETTRNMFNKVSGYFDRKIPVPFKDVYSFIEAQFDVENDAHFLDFDNKMLKAKEKAVLEIAKIKGKIEDVKEYLSDEKASWVSAFRHDGWKLAEKLGLHEEKNVELIHKLEESTRIFGKSVASISNLIKDCKDKSNLAANWMTDHLLNTVDDTQKRIETALSSIKKSSRALFTLTVPELFESAKKGIAEEIAKRDGYRIDGNGELYTPELKVVVRDKYKEVFSPVAERFKSIAQKSSSLIKKEGLYIPLGAATKSINNRYNIMNIETLPADIPLREFTKAEVDNLAHDSIKVEAALDNALCLTTLGGRNSNESISNLRNEMVNLSSVFDSIVGEKFVVDTRNLVFGKELTLSIENDLQLKPVDNEITSKSVDYLIHNFDNYSMPNQSSWKYETFKSERTGQNIIKADLITTKGETTSFFFDANKLDTPFRINYQKELGAESQTVFDLVNKTLSISAINNIATLKVAIEGVPELMDNLKTICTDKLFIDPNKEPIEVIRE